MINDAQAKDLRSAINDVMETIVLHKGAQFAQLVQLAIHSRQIVDISAFAVQIAAIAARTGKLPSDESMALYVDACADVAKSVLMLGGDIGGHNEKEVIEALEWALRITGDTEARLRAASGI